jgi:DNA-binding transcriptional ArsR family regulator
MTSPFLTDQMARNAREAAALLKALSHEARLMIMCLLMEGERSVTDRLLPDTPQDTARGRVSSAVDHLREVDDPSAIAIEEAALLELTREPVHRGHRQCRGA